MHKTSARRYLVTGSVLAGVVVVMASAAYACTNFRGTMTVTGGGGSTKVVGSGSGMTYCAGYPNDNAAAPAGGAHGKAGASITIAVAKSTVCNAYQLPAATYNANITGGKAYSFTVNSTTHRRTYSRILIDCMFRGRGVSALTPGTLSVPASGTASGSFKIPAGVVKNGPTDAGAVCLAQPNGSYGLQSPIIIT